MGDPMYSQNGYHQHDLPTLLARDPLNATELDGDATAITSLRRVPMPSLHPRDVDQTVRHIRALVKRATDMVCVAAAAAVVLSLLI